MHHRAVWMIACIQVMLMGSSVVDASPQAFVSGSYAQLLARQDGKPFVLSFWSLDCPPCYRELALWGEQQRAGSRLPLVLVSTDAPADAGEIDALLMQHGLQSVESWVFSTPAAALRYEIDRHWRGELPRTYLIERGAVVEAVTGVLDEARLADWLERLE